MKSRLEGREIEIAKMLASASQTSVAKTLGVGRGTLRNFIRTRGISPAMKEPEAHLMPSIEAYKPAYAPQHPARPKRISRLCWFRSSPR